MHTNEKQPSGLTKEFPFTGSPAFLERFGQVAETLKRHKTILLTGEPGTGKTALAKFLCRVSPLYQKTMRIVRLDEIPLEQTEQELFGHDGFAGRIKATDEGTIILKDILHLPGHLQAKFLRLLEENEFERVGEPAIVKVNLRVIGITSANLLQAALENKFRQDLYYHLSATTIVLSPLRVRIEDIEPISLYYLNRTALQQRKYLERISPQALQTLQSYTWPGNVRELKAEIEQAVATVASEKKILELDDLSPKVRLKLPQTNAPFSHLAEKIKFIERQMIVEAIALNQGNKSQTAQYLGIKLRTLYEKMKTLNISL